MNLGDLAQTCLKFAPRLVLYTSVLDEHGEVMLAVLACVPSEVVGVLCECVGPQGFKLISKQLLDFGFVHIKTHTVDCVLETRILGRQLVRIDHLKMGLKLDSLPYDCRNLG